jgi:hypothetical protein
MSTTIYLKCPRCGRLNPIPPVETNKEHTCVFCGAIIPPQPAGKHDDAKAKEHIRKFPVDQSQTKPTNRNQRKPMI